MSGATTLPGGDREAGTAERDAIEPPKRRSVAVIALPALSFLLFAVPVLRSNNVDDPVENKWTDHLRYRYCAALVLRSPIHALTVPLEVQYREDSSSHRVATWGAEPCHQGGIVHLALHAPLQWLLWGELIDEPTATRIYVLFVLAIAHLCLYLLATGPVWWSALVLYPFLLRTSLLATQEPIVFLFALLAASSWASGRRARALAFIVLTVSAYVRWIIVLPPMAWLAWRDRSQLLAELRTLSARRWTAPLALALLTTLAVSLVAAVLVFMNRTPEPQPVEGVGRMALLVWIVVWIIHAGRRTDSNFAPFALAWAVFAIANRGRTQFWYTGPMVAMGPMARPGFERVMWAVGAAVFSGLIGQTPALECSDLLAFAWRQWLALLGLG